jgi:magnesium chelatase family protein
MQECPCGYLGDPGHRCTCGEVAIQKYRARISGPLLDRIDLQVDVPVAPFEQLADTRRGEPSEVMRARVEAARHVQARRFRGSQTRANAMMTPGEIEAFATPGKEGLALLQQAMARLRLSARAYTRILKVARTIADLAGAERIETTHLAEAIQYRKLDRGAA